MNKVEIHITEQGTWAIELNFAGMSNGKFVRFLPENLFYYVDEEVNDLTSLLLEETNQIIR